MLNSYLEVEDYSQVWIEEIDPVYVFSRQTDRELPLDEDFVFEMNSLVDEYFDDLFIYTGDIGVTIDKKNIELDKFEFFKDVFYASNDSSNAK